MLPAVTVTLLATVFPTAYSRQLTAEAFPFVTVSVDNSAGLAPATVTALAVIEGRSDPAVHTTTVPRGECQQLPLLPLLRQEELATLTEIRPATLRVTVTAAGRGLAGALRPDHTHRTASPGRGAAGPARAGRADRGPRGSPGRLGHASPAGGGAAPA